MNLVDDADDPNELCLQCHGAGCDYCGGTGELPFGTQYHEDDDPDYGDEEMEDAWFEARYRNYI